MTLKNDIAALLQRLRSDQWISTYAIAHELGVDRDDVIIALGELYRNVRAKRAICCITGLDRLCYQWSGK